MQVNYYEEKTPKGYTLKIVQKKLNFLVFDHNGSSVYSDKAASQVVHQIPVVAFFGNDFSIKSRVFGEYNLYKVSQNKIIIPYTVYGKTENNYLLIDTDEAIDIMPVKTVFHEELISFVKEIDLGLRPDYLVIDNNVTENDLIVIRNRCQMMKIINIMTDTAPADQESDDDGRRISDEFSDISLNMLSRNPVFLARIHLRNLSVSKVKQLLLDFDLSSIDAGYILTFIQTMLKNDTDEISKIRGQLLSLETEFSFYVNLADGKTDDVYRQIESASTVSEISSLMTVLAKYRSIYDENGIDENMNKAEEAIAGRRREIGQ